MTLLLVDTAVAGYEQIVAAAQPSVTTVLFDRYVDSFITLKEKVATALGGAQATVVGIVQHGSAAEPTYKLLEAQDPAAVVSSAESADPALSTWVLLIDFYSYLKTTYGTTTIDLISCALYANSGWVYVLQKLEAQLQLNFRASINDTGNIASGGDWIQESDGDNIQDIYFTDAIQEYTGLLISSNSANYYDSNQMVVLPGATINSKPLVGFVSSSFSASSSSLPERFVTKSAVVASSVSSWGASLTVPSSGSGYTAIVSSWYAFAALRADGTIGVWGDTSNGASGAPTGSGYVGISSTLRAFAALRNDGSITAWGNSGNGGSGGPSGSGFIAIAGTQQAFAALRSNGSIAAWGSSTNGENVSPAGSGFVTIASTNTAFTALKSDGSIVAWGNATNGGAGAPPGSGFISITSTTGAFAALKSDGSIVVWGNASIGGTNPAPGSGYVRIVANNNAFAALKLDGSIVAWGSATQGGTSPSGSGFVVIASSASDFAAMRSDGTIVAWGSNASNAPLGSGFLALTANAGAFAALKSDGTISSWGLSNYGGSGTPPGSGFVAIAASFFSFSALRSDGSLTAWGEPTAGGINASAGSGFVSIGSNNGSFSAFKAAIPTDATTAVNSNIAGNYVVLSNDSTTNVVINTRAAINGVSGALKTSARNYYVKGMIQRMGSTTNTIPSSRFADFKNTLLTGGEFLSLSKNIVQYFPVLNVFETSATLEISSFPTDNSVYVCLELPIGIPVTLTENGTPVANGILNYDGTTLTRTISGTPTTITAGSTEIFGSKTINGIAIGSLTGGAGPLPTPPTAPTISPNPQVQSTTSIKCDWTADPSLYQYTIQITGGSPITLPSSTNTYTFTGLTPGTNYTATLFVTDYYDQNSPISTYNTVPLGTLPAQPTIKPNPLVTPDSITCFWTNDPSLSTFAIQLEADNGTQFYGPVIVPAATSSYTFPAWKPQGIDIIPSIRSTDNFNQTGPSSVFRTVQYCSRPGAPTNVVFTKIGSILRVTWDPLDPSAYGGATRFEGYIVRDSARTPGLVFTAENYETMLEAQIPSGTSERTYTLCAVNYAGYGALVTSDPIAF